MTDVALRSQPDSILCSLASAGSEAAFETLVQRYRRPLVNYCRRIVQSDSEDVVQEAFLSAWSCLQAGAEVQHTKAWLYRIVRNQALNDLRRRDSELEPLPESTPSAGGVELELERSMATRDALAAVAKLPELQREAIVMTAVHGISYEQTAKSMGVSDTTVRGLVYRARASLRAGFAAVAPSPLLAWLAQQEISTAATPVAVLVGGGGSSAGLLKSISVLTSAATILGSTVGGIVTAHHAPPKPSPHVSHQVSIAASHAQVAPMRAGGPVAGAPTELQTQRLASSGVGLAASAGVRSLAAPSGAAAGRRQLAVTLHASRRPGATIVGQSAGASTAAPVAHSGAEGAAAPGRTGAASPPAG